MNSTKRIGAGTSSQTSRRSSRHSSGIAATAASSAGSSRPVMHRMYARTTHWASTSDASNSRVSTGSATFGGNVTTSGSQNYSGPMTTAAGSTLTAANSYSGATTAEEKETRLLAWREYIKGNYRFMTEAERAETIARLERLAELRRGEGVTIQSTGAQPGVVFGYAFNISKCKGFRSCVEACINENNLDRSAATQYIRIFEMEDGVIDFDEADATFQHEVPADGHFYLGTQCFQCADPPCVKVCPVGATWQEPDGITVVDYDWCIGCRCCMSACPYGARHMNWAEPKLPPEQLNPVQHYLGNRPRPNNRSQRSRFLTGPFDPFQESSRRHRSCQFWLKHFST